MEHKRHVKKSLSGGTRADPLKSIILRTPEERFQNLEGWSYAPKYVENLDGFANLRMHYIEAGKPDARRTVLCLHGQKTWSYAFRKAIPEFIRNSFRVIAVDLFGFGRSDKLANDYEYSFCFHRKSIMQFIQKLDLKNVYIAGFDWGSCIGATLPMSLPDRISGLILGNFSMYTSSEDVWPGFHLWKSLHNAEQDPPIGHSLRNQEISLTPGEIAAYNAPFPDFRYKAAVRKFPNLVPISDDSPTSNVTQQALDYLKSDWAGKCVCIAGLTDSVFGQKSMRRIQSRIKNAKPLVKVKNGGSLIFERADDFMPTVIDAIH